MAPQGALLRASLDAWSGWQTGRTKMTRKVWTVAVGRYVFDMFYTKPPDDVAKRNGGVVVGPFTVADAPAPPVDMFPMSRTTWLGLDHPYADDRGYVDLVR